MTDSNETNTAKIVNLLNLFIVSPPFPARAATAARQHCNFDVTLTTIVVNNLAAV
jgi:hypothetical protein